ncbi:hypothetical protein DFH29DRAFT_1081797 [Suillus ampliporus]|nr:hypothetical protein DFH29DRAFT_1081797 [Suillus ampliporus]
MKLERVLLQSLPESDSHSKAGSCGLLGRLIIVGPYVEGVDTAFPLDDRPRPKHRLPPATSINDISLSIISQTTLQQQRGGVPPPSRNSELRPDGKAKQMENRLIDVDTSRRKINIMPPSKCLLQLKSHDQFERPRRHDLGPLARSPVQQSNCFFPHDEDDEESGPAPQHKSPVSPQIQSEVPAKRTRDEGTTNRDEDFRRSGLSRPLPFQHVPGPHETVPKTQVGDPDRGITLLKASTTNEADLYFTRGPIIVGYAAATFCLTILGYSVALEATYSLAYILTYTLSIVLCIVVFVMLCWHLWSVSRGDYCRGIEDHEAYKRIAKDRGDNFVNFYDLGKSTNLRLFFNIGPNGCPSYTLVLPLRIMPYTDGPLWAAKFDLDDDLEYNDLKLDHCITILEVPQNPPFNTITLHPIVQMDDVDRELIEGAVRLKASTISVMEDIGAEQNKLQLARQSRQELKLNRAASSNQVYPYYRLLPSY